MDIERLIETFTAHGFRFECGPHGGKMVGHYAVFYRPSEDHLPTRDWDACGHGAELWKAVVMAARLAVGRPVTVPPMTVFLRGNCDRQAKPEARGNADV
jgi:hypothetical protein